MIDLEEIEDNLEEPDSISQNVRCDFVKDAVAQSIALQEDFKVFERARFV